MPEALRKIAARYALTDKRIAALIEARRHPAPLPDKLPNPFQRGLEATETEAGLPAADATVVPVAPDESDDTTLVKVAATLRLGGLVIRNGQPLITINAAVCKVGDILPITAKNRTLYVQVERITPDELVLGLNEARHTIRLRR
jgi:hypothetical protein